MTDNYPPAAWLPAPSGNYGVGRPGGITTIIIHDTEGTYVSALSRFTDPSQHVSAHFVLRARDGDLTRCVLDADTAYHCGNLEYNQRSIGIEHELLPTDPDGHYPAPMLTQSAKLVAVLCSRYNIPIDRAHIIGHNEVPDPNNPALFGGIDHHHDPRGWDWPRYLQMVRAQAAPVVYPTGCTIEAWAQPFYFGNGALRIFGYPVSQQMSEGGLAVQYFERARFELSPEGQVGLGLVGREAYQAKYHK